MRKREGGEGIARWKEEEGERWERGRKRENDRGREGRKIAYGMSIRSLDLALFMKNE